MNASSPPPNLFSVDISKIALYLLNVNHPSQSARAKANFYVSHGFDPNKPLDLANALIMHGQQSPLISASNNGYVDLFIYEGKLSGPYGPIPRIRSVWKIDRRPDTGELVTAYRY